jgi:hypothetical protein
MEESASGRRAGWRRLMPILNSLVWIIVAIVIMPQACELTGLIVRERNCSTSFRVRESPESLQ